MSQIELTSDALADLSWIEAYCRQHSEKAMLKAQSALDAVFDQICDNPFIGRQYENDARIRSFPLTKMPFRVFYTVYPEKIIVLRIWDVRARPSNLKL